MASLDEFLISVDNKHSSNLDYLPPFLTREQRSLRSSFNRCELYRVTKPSRPKQRTDTSLNVTRATSQRFTRLIQQTVPCYMTPYRTWFCSRDKSPVSIGLLN